jgi:hypothetical protein
MGFRILTAARTENGLLHHVVWYKLTDVSEILSASTITFIAVFTTARQRTQS